MNLNSKCGWKCQGYTSFLEFIYLESHSMDYKFWYDALSNLRNFLNIYLY